MYSIQFSILVVGKDWFVDQFDKILLQLGNSLINNIGIRFLP